LAEEAARDGERFLFIEETNDNIVRTGVNTLTASFDSGVSGIFFGNDTDGYRFIIGSSGNTDARETAKLLKEKLDARGGGKSEMVQGSVTASKDIILKTLS
jgi:alanyl-tRNA synthetase